MPWPEVLNDFNCFCAVNPTYEPMRRLVHDLKPFEHPLVNGGRPQLFEGRIEHFRKYGANGILVVSAKPAEEAWNTRSAPILEP